MVFHIIHFCFIFFNHIYDLFFKVYNSMVLDIHNKMEVIVFFNCQVKKSSQNAAIDFYANLSNQTSTHPESQLGL